MLQGLFLGTVHCQDKKSKKIRYFGDKASLRNVVYFYNCIVTVVKARRVIWAGHVAHMGEVHTTFWLGGLKGGDY
jgi:hypothetical protein